MFLQLLRLYLTYKLVQLFNTYHSQNGLYNRVYNFFTKNNLIYPLQFDSRQQYSTFHDLISLSETKYLFS